MIVSLQFLRFLAASLVVLTHVRLEFDKLGPATIAPFGAFGVDVFFVISGFVISHITERDTSRFLSKRLIRIVPLYWAFTLALAAISYALPHLLNSAVFDGPHLLASLLFFPLWTEGTGFKPILLLGWTLNYEMFFYLLFYVSMRIDHRYRELLCSALLIGICVTVGAIDPAPTSPLAFYADPIVLEFVFGMALALAWRRSAALRSGLPTAGGAALVLASAVAFYLTDGDSAHLEELPRSLVWGLPALLLVAATMGLERHFRALGARAREIVLLLGEISYPLYLIHIYLVALLSRVLDLTSLGIAGFLAVSLSAASIASWLALRLYDVPVRGTLSRRLAHAA